MNSFSQEIEWINKNPLPYNIYSGSAVTCQDKIYFVGGQIDIGSGNFDVSNKLFEYNIDLDEWLEKPNMPTARFNLAAATVNGKIYTIGGDEMLDENESYDPTTDAWQTLSPMPTARQHIKAAVVDNKIYIIGGLLSWYSVSTKNERYDPQTDTWEEMAPIPTAKHNYSTIVYNDKIYIFGGATQNGTNVWEQTSSVQVYDPANNTWDTAASLPSLRFNPGIGMINNKIIIVGGYSGDEVLNSVDVFDPVENIWSQMDSLPVKNVAMGSTTIDNKIYIIGGTSGDPSWVGYNSFYEGIYSESTGTVVDQIEEVCDLLLYPNPAKDYVQVEIMDPQYELRTYQLFSLDGRIKQEGIFHFNQINISRLNSGVYFLNLKSGKCEIMKRLVIEH